MNHYFKAGLSVFLAFVLYFFFSLLIVFAFALIASVLPFLVNILDFLDRSRGLYYIPHAAMSFGAMSVPAIVFKALMVDCPANVKKWSGIIACGLICLVVLFFYTSDILERFSVCITAYATFKAITSES